MKDPNELSKEQLVEIVRMIQNDIWPNGQKREWFEDSVAATDRDLAAFDAIEAQLFAIGLAP